MYTPATSQKKKIVSVYKKLGGIFSNKISVVPSPFLNLPPPLCSPIPFYFPVTCDLCDLQPPLLPFHDPLPSFMVLYPLLQPLIYIHMNMRS